MSFHWNADTEKLFLKKIKDDTQKALPNVLRVIIPFFAAFIFLDLNLFPRALFLKMTETRIFYLAILGLLYFIGRAKGFPSWLSHTVLLVLGIGVTNLGLISGGYLSPYFFGMCLVILVVSNVFPWGPKKTAAWAVSLSLTYLLSISIYAHFTFENQMAIMNDVAFVSSCAIITIWGSWISDTLRRQSFAQFLEAKNEQSAKRIREEFISIASHELKTPLTTMKLQSDYLNKYLSQVDLGEHKEFLRKHNDRTENQIKRLVRLVDDMLDFSRITAGTLILNSEKMSLVDSANAVLKKLSKLLQESNISVSLKVESDALGNWDRGRIEQVMTSIISNAIKYAPGAPLEIRIGKRSNDRALLEIQDHGPGLPKDFHEKIFDRFDWSAIDPNISGLGLGLYVSNQIIRSHGGTLKIDGNNEVGTHFTIELPIRDDSPKNQFSRTLASPPIKRIDEKALS